MKILRLLGILLALVAFVPLPGCSCNTSKTQDQLILGYDPETIDFGVVPVGQIRSVDVTLSHIGASGTILVNSWTLDGPSGAVLITLDPDKTSLLTGEQTVLTVTYTPTSPNIEGGYLVIKHNVLTQGGGETRIPITSTAPVADLIAQPNPADFGQVHSCTTGEAGFKDLDIKIINAGTDSATILGIRLDADGSPDFSKEGLSGPNGDSLPVDLGPNQSLGVVVRYEPRGSDCGSTTLFVDGEQKGEARQWSFPIRGCGIGPKLVVAPGQVDFGWLPQDVLTESTFTIMNTGNADLVLKANGMNPSLGSDPEIKVKDPLTEDLVIPAGGDKLVTVTWTAKVDAEDPAPRSAGCPSRATTARAPRSSRSSAASTPPALT